jgi:hypothetical protein
LVAVSPYLSAAALRVAIRTGWVYSGADDAEDEPDINEPAGIVLAGP